MSLKVLLGLASLVALCADLSPSHAASRTFVSGKGADSGSCAVTQPCRSFAYAIGQTDAGGEIAVLDTAGYGAVTINKSVSIINQDGVEAGVSVAGSATGVTVSNGTVRLRGLSITGSGSGAIGISFTGARTDTTLAVDHCSITGMTQAGIAITPMAAGNVVITDTTIANNAGDGIVATASGSGRLFTTISRSKIYLNGFTTSGNGVHLKGTSASFDLVYIDNTLISQNGTGLYLESNGANSVTLLSAGDSVVGNVQSIYVGSGASAYLEKTSVTSNGGITNNGNIFSFGDNAIADNVSGTALQSMPLQ